MKLKELPQIVALSTEEKLDLIHDLWGNREKLN